MKLNRSESAEVNSDDEATRGGLRRDFEAWLNSLQAGNLTAAKTAFRAVKMEFQNDSRATVRPRPK